SPLSGLVIWTRGQPGPRWAGEALTEAGLAVPRLLSPSIARSSQGYQVLSATLTGQHCQIGCGGVCQAMGHGLAEADAAVVKPRPQICQCPGHLLGIVKDAKTLQLDGAGQQLAKIRQGHRLVVQVVGNQPTQR